MRRFHTELVMILAASVGCTALKGMVHVDGSGATSGGATSGGGGGGDPSGDRAATGGGWDLAADRVYVVAADPGKPTAPAMAPTWCQTKDKVPGAHDSILIKGYLEFDAQRRQWPLADWPTAAALLCDNPSSGTVKQQTGYLVQLYVNRWDLTVDEAVRAVAADASFESQHHAAMRKTCDELTGARPERDGLAASAEAAALAGIYGCGGTDAGVSWPLWRTPRAQSALVRLALVDSLLATSFEPESVDSVVSSGPMVNFLAAAPLFDQLDKKAIVAELDRRGAPEWAKVNALRTLGNVRRRIAVGEQLYGELVKRDKDWKALRDAAARRFADWKAEYKANAAAFAAAAAVDEALASDAKSARAACKPEPLTAAVAKLLKRARPASVDALKDAVSTPTINILAHRAAACLVARGEPLEALVLSAIATTSAIDHGGTDAQLKFAELAALEGLRQDREHALDGVSVDARGRDDGPDAYVASRLDDHVAKVARVTAKGDELEVVFAPELREEEQCTHTVETHRIDRIDADGRIRYREECTSWKKVKVNVAPAAIRIAKRWAAGVAPGAYTRMLRLGDAGAPTGAVWAIFTDKTGKQPSSFFGIAFD